MTTNVDLFESKFAHPVDVHGIACITNTFGSIWCMITCSLVLKVDVTRVIGTEIICNTETGAFNGVQTVEY